MWYRIDKLPLKLLLFFILITYLVDIVFKLYGGILSWSLMGVKELKGKNAIFCSLVIQNPGFFSHQVLH